MEFGRTITFILGEPQEKKNSVRFDFSEALDFVLAEQDELTPAELKAAKTASFYIPKPIAAGAKRIAVTIAVVKD